MHTLWRSNRRLPAPRRGVTLIELMVVLTIMLMVTAAAIPIMIPAMQNRRMREASRLVSSYISGARARAIETGRPVGVMFERFNGQPFSMNLSYVEVPQPYGGDTTASRIFFNPPWQVRDTTGVVIGSLSQVGFFPPTDPVTITQIRYGDLVRFDYKGPTYVIAAIMPPLIWDAVGGSWFIQSNTFPTPDPNAVGRPVPLPTQALPSPAPAPVGWFLFRADGFPFVPPAAYIANGVSFQIYRQPLRSSAAPMQMPEGSVVDLAASGVGLGNSFSNAFTTAVTFNPVITFSPTGAVDYVGVPTLTRPNNPIFFLVGRRDLMPDASKTGFDENMYDAISLQHLSNFWVSIGYQTGHVSVTENMAAGRAAADFANARQFARTGQSVGGR